MFVGLCLVIINTCISTCDVKFLSFHSWRIALLSIVLIGNLLSKLGLYNFSPLTCKFFCLLEIPFCVTWHFSLAVLKVSSVDTYDSFRAMYLMEEDLPWFRLLRVLWLSWSECSLFFKIEKISALISWIIFLYFFPLCFPPGTPVMGVFAQLMVCHKSWRLYLFNLFFHTELFQKIYLQAQK